MIPVQFFAGTVVKDGELRYTSNGTPVGTVRIAVNDNKKNDSGQWENIRSLFLHVQGFDTTGEILGGLKQGAQVGIEGKLETQTWDDNGVKKSMIVLKAYSVYTRLTTTQNNNNPADNFDDTPPF